MADENPYKTPAAVVLDPPQVHALAGRWQRLGAAMIDGIIGLIVALPIMYQLGIFDAIMTAKKVPYSVTLISAVFGFVVFLLIHGYLLKKNGQTVGKKIVGLRISDLQEGVPNFGRLITLRYLPISLVSIIPVVGQILPLVDILFIFRSDRRCVHDLLAGTKVVKLA